LLFSTGFTDSVGKEIFEGQLIYRTNDDEDDYSNFDSNLKKGDIQVYEVHFYEGSFCTMIGDSYVEDLNMTLGNYEYLVMGNIYELNKLLK